MESDILSQELYASGTYFRSLKVENVRCFGAEQTLDLTDRSGKAAQWTVILGDNGSGKSTLLQSLALARPTTRLAGTSEKLITSTFPHDLNSRNFWGFLPASHDGNSRVNVEIGLESPLNSNGSILELFETEFGEDRDSESQGRWSSRILQDDRVLELFCCAYGANRRVGTTSLADTEKDDPITSLINEDSNLRNAEEWLLQTDYVASKRSKVQKYARIRLDLVKKILISLLPDVDDIKVSEPKKASATPSVLFHTPFGWVPIKGLGLGYKTLVAWMIDYASRLFGRDPDSADPLAQPAVCLVDEIDLHLHPRWQRRIMQDLSTHFPNTQFIVTAHSPLFVQSAAGRANIAVLRRTGDHVVIDQSFEGVQGWRVDQILTSDLFGLESARGLEFELLMNERERLLSKKRLSAQERARLGEIAEKLSSAPLGETGTEQEALAILRRAAEAFRDKSSQT